jgi:CheY-like chemotaxis protein
MPAYEQAAVMDDVEEDARALKDELEKRALRTEICVSEQELLDFLSGVEKAVVAVDIDMGENRRREGIETIEKLKSLQDESGHDYYVAALTSHSELKKEAAQAGADAFITKLTSVTDALELMTRASAHAIERENQKAQELQDELARREYKNLIRQLGTLRRKTGRARIETATETVQRALGWPLLRPGEQAILSALDEQLRAAGRHGKLSRAVLDLCLEGAGMLNETRGSDGNVRNWLQRLASQSANIIFRWVKDE